MKSPKITVIIPTFNEASNIERCLSSIRGQDYPQNKIKILLVDDISTDATVKISKRYNVKVLLNGTHNIERAKSIGLKNAETEYVLFFDADNYFVNNNWISEACSIYSKHSRITGVESYKYFYNKNDSLVNRYCSLFGINDPLVFYLGRRGYLMAYENKWPYPKQTLLLDAKDYFLVRFETTNLQTIGSNGYLTKKSLLKKTDWSPYLFHMDSAYDLVGMGFNEFARNKQPIGHNNSSSIINMLKKLKRNIDLYWKYNDIRRYKYGVGSLRFILGVIATASVVVPLIDSVKGYLKIKDPVWFLHPFLSFAVVVIYATSTVENLLKSK